MSREGRLQTTTSAATDGDRHCATSVAERPPTAGSEVVPKKVAKFDTIFSCNASLLTAAVALAAAPLIGVALMFVSSYSTD
jgi:hypothetical protein